MIEQKSLEQNNDTQKDNIHEYLVKKEGDLRDEGFSDIETKKNKNKKIAIGALIALLVFLIFAYFSYSKGQKSFANENVTLSIETPEDVESGTEISFTIGYKNENEISLKNGRLEMFFPDNFIMTSSDKELGKDGNISFWSIDSIPANSMDKIRIFGRLIGDKDSASDFRAILKYKPSNFNSIFETSATKSVEISSVPVELEISSPEESIKDDTDTALTFSVKNKSNRNFSKAQIKIELPENFEYTPSENSLLEQDGENNSFIFETENLLAGEEKSISVEGSFHSENGKENVKADVYLLEENGEFIKYAEQTKEFQIEKPEILVSVTINGSEDYYADKNEELEYKIDFENQSDKEIRGLTLNSKLGNNFDLSSINATEGRISNDEIIWSALRVPALAQLKPQEKGNVSFKVKVKDYFTIAKDSDKDFVLENNITIKTSTAEIVSITKSIKVKAFLALETKAYFNDDGRIENGGALPPRAGEKTYYTVHWSLRNLFSETKNIRIVATLPQGVKWTGKYIDSKGKVITEEIEEENATESVTSTTSENVEENQEIEISEEKVFYDKNTNEMVWEIPVLKPNEGILSSAKEIVFQIEISPEEENVNKEMDILNITNASGYDTFTQQNIFSSKDKLTTKLTNDFSIGEQEAIVQTRK